MSQIWIKDPLTLANGHASAKRRVRVLIRIKNSLVSNTYTRVTSASAAVVRVSSIAWRKLTRSNIRPFKYNERKYYCTQSSSISRHKFTGGSKRSFKCGECEISVYVALSCRKCNWPLIYSCRFLSTCTAPAVKLLLSYLRICSKWWEIEQALL